MVGQDLRRGKMKPRNDLFVNFDIGAYCKPTYLKVASETPFEVNV